MVSPQIPPDTVRNSRTELLVRAMCKNVFCAGIWHLALGKAKEPPAEWPEEGYARAPAAAGLPRERTCERAGEQVKRAQLKIQIFLLENTFLVVKP